MVELFYDLNKFLLYFVIGQRINRAEELRLKLPHLLFMSAFALLVDIVLNRFCPSTILRPAAFWGS